MARSLPTDPNTIKGHVLDFYNSFKEDNHRDPSYAIIDDIIPHSIHLAQEVEKAMFSLDPNSAPNPDGYTGLFYYTCWDIIKVDIIEAVQSFFCIGSLPP